MSMQLNVRWLDFLNIVSSCHMATSRGMMCREMLGTMFHANMDDPILTIVERKLGYAHMFGEAAWILSGDNKLKPLLEDNPRMAEFSDDGETLAGAYGPPFMEQVSWAANKLRADPGTRQAVINIWKKRPKPSKDIPCTLSLQFLIRDCYLHLNVFMRSSDVWLGLPYDIFAFSMMAHYMRLMLECGPALRCGCLRIMAGSSHVYEHDLEMVKEILNKRLNFRDIRTMCLYDLNTPDSLVTYLRALRNDPKSVFTIW